MPRCPERVIGGFLRELEFQADPCQEREKYALRGSTVTKVLEGQRSYDVTLRLPDSARTDIDSIRKIPIDTLNGRCRIPSRPAR